MRPLLPLGLCLLLAGCFGYPEGAALTGDSVAVEITVMDLATGEPIVQNQTLFWQVGSDRTGLGPRLDEAVRGLPVNGTFRFDLAGASQLEAPREATLARPVAPENLTARVSVQEYLAALRQEPTVGTRLRYTPEVPGLDRGYAPSYFAAVSEVTNETVFFRLNVTEQASRISATAIHLEARADGEQLERRLAATEGEAFVVRVPPGQPTPFGLPQGAYLVRDVTEQQIVLAYNPDVDLPVLLRDVRVEGKVLAVSDRAQEPVDGNLVVRDSPVLSGGRAAAPSSTPPPADDGHGHTH